MKMFTYIWKMLIAPRKVAQELLQEPGVGNALLLVVGFGVITSLLIFKSYMDGVYPPPEPEFSLRNEIWGEFSQLPIIHVPIESYRLFLSVALLPLVIASWMLMAGVARFFSLVFKGSVRFTQYLNLLAFSFFPFWILTFIMDSVYSGLIWESVLPALRMERGVFLFQLAKYFPMLMYPIVLGFGGVYNGLVVQAAERYSFCKAALVGMLTFFIPLMVITLLMR